MPVLEANIRNNAGKRDSRILRKNGLIPVVIYGHGKDTVSVTMKVHDIDLAIGHGERLLEIDIDGKKENVLFKEVQWDTFGQKILHVDLTRVDLNERINLTVPIVLRGTPAGASEDGVLQQAAAEVNVECLARAIPEEIRLSVNAMNIGDALHMSDLELPEGVKLLDEADTLVCSVTIIAEEVEAEPVEGEESTQPEVIGEKAEEESEGEEASE